MHEQDAHGWCAGMTLGDGMGREVGEAFWMGNTCAPVADSCRYTKSWTQLSDFPFTFHFHALEKEMATHSSVLAWRIPGMGEPGGLLSLGSHRVGHN